MGPGGPMGMSGPGGPASSLPGMMAGPGGPGGPGGNGASQPLVSNVLHKQQSHMDQQYMQQSSQIYVFSTTWANKGAEAVMQGAFPTIICWHENQPETRKHLQVGRGDT